MIIDLMQQRIKRQKPKMKDTLWRKALQVIQWVHQHNKQNQIKIITAALTERQKVLANS